MSLHEKALLVKMTIHQWHNHITDKAVSHDVASRYEVSEQDGRYVKTLISHGAVKAIECCVRDLRAYHNNNTLPWGNDGSRLLPSRNFLAYQQGLMEKKAELTREVSKLARDLPFWI